MSPLKIFCDPKSPEETSWNAIGKNTGFFHLSPHPNGRIWEKFDPFIWSLGLLDGPHFQAKPRFYLNTWLFSWKWGLSQNRGSLFETLQNFLRGAMLFGIKYPTNHGNAKKNWSVFHYKKGPKYLFCPRKANHIHSQGGSSRPNNLPDVYFWGVDDRALEFPCLGSIFTPYEEMLTCISHCNIWKNTKDKIIRRSLEGGRQRVSFQVLVYYEATTIGSQAYF